jgi:hypothetical protein
MFKPFKKGAKTIRAVLRTAKNHPKAAKIHTFLPPSGKISRAKSDDDSGFGIADCGFFVN